MGLEILIQKQLKVVKNILNEVKSNEKLDNKEKQKSVELLKQIEEYFKSIMKNFKLFLEGNQMRILTCHNNYQWSKNVFISFVKNIKEKWNNNLESFRLELLNLLYDVRKILVEKHNDQVPQHYPEEKIEQYDVNKNKIETLINNYYPFELFNLLKTQLNAIDESSLKPIELESLFDIKGVLEARFGELDKAIDIYEKASDKVPDSFCLNYNLALLLEKKGEMKKAFKYFSKVVSNEAEDPEILLIITRLYYLWDYYSEGLDLIQNILDMYYEIGIIDDHVVSMRGYPTYGETFANLAVFANFLKKPDLAFNELEKAKKELTDYPFEWLESQLKTFVSNSWTEGLEKIEEEIKQLREENSPLGYHLTLQALIKAREASSYEEAIKILESVKLTSFDYDWLKDIINLSKAEAANRFDENEEEQKFRKEFLEDQPLLFEPYHVFRFGIDKYQEILKETYQKEQRSVDSGIKIHYFFKS